MEGIINPRTAFQCGAKDRLKAWRDFRLHIKDHSLDEQIVQAVEWWSQVPLSSTDTIDPYSPTTWPTPWEMLHEGSICEYSAMLGVAYTLYYLDESRDNITVQHVANATENFFIILLPQSQDRYILIYSLYEPPLQMPDENVEPQWATLSNHNLKTIITQ